MRLRNVFGLQYAARVLLTLALLAMPSLVRAQTLWVVLIPGTSLADWRQANAPHLHQIMATGSIALMNTRTARTPSHVRETPESAALTLGAGSRAAGGPEATVFQPQNAFIPGVGVTAGQLYTRRMGLSAPPGAWVDAEWPRVIRENAAQGYDLRPGNLADALHQAGIAIIAEGGTLADTMAASSAGWVFPAPPSLQSAGRSCIIWDAGSGLHTADAVLGFAMTRIGSGRLIVLSATAGDAAYARGDRLCPVAVWGRGIPAGLIVSSATRRAGLVTDTDFATAVAADFGLTPADFPVRPFGDNSPWTFHSAPDAMSQIAALDTGARRQWAGMRALPYLALFLGALMAGAIVYSARHSLPRGAIAVPTALVLALLLSDSPETLVLWLAVALISAVWVRPAGYAMLVSGLLVADMLCGDPLMRQSLLGYSAIEGARYYGIGNEAMGALVGACLVAADAGQQRLHGSERWVIWIGLALVTILLGSPTAGAKAGGLLVALAAFGSYAWLCAGRRLTLRVVVVGVTAISAFLLTVAFLDARLSGRHASHLGQAAARLHAGGAHEWGDIIGRKLAVEGHLLWHSAWAVPLWVGLASFGWLSRRLPLKDRPLFDAGLVAVLACLAVNDAGAVAGALCLVMLWSRLLEAEQKQAHRLRKQTVG